MPIHENSAPRKMNIAKGITPICCVRKGKLNTPVPMALANNAKMEPRSEPYFMGPKYLSMNFLCY